jgi:hypothetical protein
MGDIKKINNNIKECWDLIKAGLTNKKNAKT